MIDRDLAVRLVVAASTRVSDHQDELSRLDSVAGDGDHGVNMATALAEAARRAEQGDHATAADVMRATGSAFHETVGGAAGALFGAFFGAMAGQFSKAVAPDATELVAGMEKGLARVARVGKAEPGHKTMIDALAPAVSDARESLERDGGLEAVMVAAARAARRGATETADMRPSAGRARFAPDHSLGAEDPGANTVALILESWADQLRTEVRE